MQLARRCKCYVNGSLVDKKKRSKETKCVCSVESAPVLLYGPYKHICVSINFLKLMYFALNYFQIILISNSTQLN